MKRALLVPALTALAACGPLSLSGGSGLQLSVDRVLYEPGDSMTVTLTNHSDDEIGYNLCPAALEVRQGADWSAGPSLREACTMELRTLGPDASALLRHGLPATLTPGEYRVRVTVERPLGGGSAGVASGAFQVARPQAGSPPPGELLPTSRDGGATLRSASAERP